MAVLHWKLMAPRVSSVECLDRCARMLTESCVEMVGVQTSEWASLEYILAARGRN